MLRIFYTAGPGNAFETFRMWAAGERDLTNSHVSYSGQMFEACARYGAAALITCTHGEGEEQAKGQISIVRRPDPSWGKSGLSYHRSLRQKARQIERDALAFDANVVVVSEDTDPSHYSALRRRGVPIVQALHTRLWPDRRPLSFMQRVRARSFGKGYGTPGTVVLSASDAISAQVASVTRGGHPPIVEFLPLYRAEHFEGVPPPARSADRLEILFIGRVEENKGVLDLIAIASLLKERGVDFRFQICGVGSSLERMQQMVVDEGLAERFLFHGWCDRERLRAVLAGCHVSIVPTRSDFVEGFNQVAVESILAGRPAVASDICPAVSYVGEAVRIVRADDIPGYADALEGLARDSATLSRHVAACPAAGSRFFDTRHSFGSALDEVFQASLEKRPIRSRRIDPAVM
jgi:glycosyltransferase involved in cell wall biosynthesis